MKTLYIEGASLKAGQVRQKVMLYICWWVKIEKTPVPLREILSHMQVDGIKDIKTIQALKVLVKEGYIRRAIGGNSRITHYVQIRTI